MYSNALREGKVEELEQIIQKFLAPADVRINGDRPWDMKVHNEGLYERVLKQGSLGLGESYMDGWWDAEALDQFFYHILEAGLDRKIEKLTSKMWNYLRLRVVNPQSKRRAYEVGDRHYDAGNDLFEVMLDKHMTYTCGYWLGVNTLDEAQEKKLDTVCQNLKLKPAQKVLDIGCGWGSFAGFAAEKYGAEVVGLTVSRKQVELARERYKHLPVDIRFQDYRKLEDEHFDHAVSLGMFEHVGSKNYRTYMEIIHRCLKDGGRFVLHTIGGNYSVRYTDPWIEKYIFPNSMIPSAKQIGQAIEDLFIIELWENYGLHYDRTLMAWYNNYKKGWDQLKANYSNRFYRMWSYYLLSSAGSFRARKNNQWQIVLSKK